MATLTEAEVEAFLLDHLGRIGYGCPNDAGSDRNDSTPKPMFKAEPMVEAVP